MNWELAGIIALSFLVGWSMCLSFHKLCMKAMAKRNPKFKSGLTAARKALDKGQE